MNAVLAPKAEVPARRSFLLQRLPLGLILFSFLLLTLPLTALALYDPNLLNRFFIIPIYIWTLGVTHFVITLTIYLQSANLRFFNNSWKNRTLYFLIPAGIFISFDLYA